MTGRRLRLAMIGGGRSGSIGRVHRTAALMDGQWDLVAGALSRDAGMAAASAAEWGIAPDRSHASWADLLAGEASRRDRVDAVAICTWNDTHHPIALACLEAGLHVICEKPLCRTLGEAADLVAAARKAGRVFTVAHAYAAYPLVRMARDMVAAGEVGTVRSVVVEYASQYQAEGAPPGDWQHDPVRSGPSGVVANTGTHAHHLAEFVTGLRVAEVSADIASLVPQHRLEDHACVNLRFDNGARGHLWNTTVAPGCENGLTLRVFGSGGALSWTQEHPNHLAYTPIGGRTGIVSRGGQGMSAGALRTIRVPAGHPEGYLEGFANLYSETAALIRGDAVEADRLVAGVEEGARGVAFVHAVLQSASSGSAFVAVPDIEPLVAQRVR